jgi:hypothetical protein
MNASKNSTLLKNRHGDNDITDDVEHGVAAGTGAAAGAITGGVIGTAGGPVGTAAGAVIGGIIGAVTGEGIADTLSDDDDYWRENYRTRDYARDADYDSYRPAYLYGAKAYGEQDSRAYDEIRADLENDWNSRRSDTDMEWEKAEPAVRDAYTRERSF